MDLNELSGRHGKNNHGKKKKRNVPPAPAENDQPRLSVAEHKPEQTLQQPDTQQPKSVSRMKIIRKPDPFDVAVWGLILTAIIAAVYFFQLRAMQDTITKMDIQTRLSVRPWVGLDEGLDSITTTPLQIDRSGNASINYKILAKNYSNSPAANVWADANLVVADDLNTVYEQQGYACGDAVIGKPDIGLVLFQGRDRVFNSMPSTTKISLKHGSGYQIGVWLAGCIGYRDQFGYLCRTKFIWGLRDENGRPVQLQAPVPAVTINGHFVPESSSRAIDACQMPKYK